MNRPWVPNGQRPDLTSQPLDLTNPPSDFTAVSPEVQELRVLVARLTRRIAELEAQLEHKHTITVRVEKEYITE